MSKRAYSDYDWKQNQLIQPVAEVRASVPSSPTPVPGQFWFNTAIANGTGNGVWQYRDNSGNDIILANAATALTNAFVTITDGTNPAVASGAGVFKIRTTGTGLSVVTANNDATHGDNALFTLNSATSGANKVLLLDSNGGIAHLSYIDIGADLTGATIQGRMSISGGAMQFYNTAAASIVQIADSYNNITIHGRWTFQGASSSPTFSNMPGNIDGNLGYDTTNHVFVYYDGTGQISLATRTKAETLTNKTLTTPILSGTPVGTTGGQIGYASNDLQFGDGTIVQTVVTTTKTQTLQNKTLTTPTIGNFTNATHDHTSNSQGGSLPAGALTAAQSFRLDQFAVPTAAVSFNGQLVTNVATPVSGTDAANKAYVDAVKTGLDPKDSVRVLTTTNITLSGGAPNTYDGVTLAANDRIGVTGQTTQSQNGIYVVQTLGTGSNGTWVRAGDADASNEVTGGMFFFVTEGTVNAKTGWILGTPDPIILNTTNLNFSQFSGAGTYIGGAGLTLTGSTFDVGANANGTIVVNANDISVSSALTSAHNVIAGATAGVLARTATNTVTARSLAAGTGISITNTDFSAGNPSISITAVVSAGTGIITTYNAQGQITASTDLISSAGIPARTGTNTYAARSIAGTAGRIAATNGDGSAGNPTLDLVSGIVTAGTYGPLTVDTYGRTTGIAAWGYAASIGNGVLTTIPVTHNLGSKDVIVQVFDNSSPYDEVEVEIRRTSTTVVDVVFNNIIPSSNQFRCVVQRVA